MEISTQTPVAASAGTSAAGSNASASTGSAAGGAGSFSSALSGMMTGNASGEGATPTGNAGLSALTQLITPLIAALPQTADQAQAQTVQQIDGLIQLLDSPKGEDANALTDNPDLQAWLQQLQAMLAALSSNQPDSNQAAVPTDEGNNAEESAEALNLLLFIPMTPAVDTPAETKAGELGAIQQPKALTAQEAAALLKQLKDLVAEGKTDPKLQQTVKELPSVLMSAASKLSELEKTSADQRRVPSTIQTAAEAAPSSDAGKLVQVIPSPVQKLEALSAKATMVQLHLDPPKADEGPLFEPLNAGMADSMENQPMPLHEYIKQHGGHAQIKAPVVQMQAGTFSEDMTQFVVRSIVMGTSADGMTEAKISLYPQHLGHVEVKLTMHNGQLVAQFVADSLAGKEMLESQLSQLRTTLQSQGIQVEKLEVSQSQNYQSGMFQEGRQQQSGQSSKQQKAASGRIAAMEDELNELMEEAKTSSTAGSLGTGSIDVTA
ncbi:flagellar hook-length control protein FliK [Paenibacillus sp. MZ04-78.2]|uniref:flagellar hook-length control protein FliK n=1 Tax=Paenibacillus sp. MZ04-78.2 TaxID=2962034 RepID=UPI0020B756C3|nr:flagellar hook-length control protein FliK [Paenibacillus sp. MZ04-78.2]MCP3772801.1 flagellar hook-length control protein FliK [Paenibacillus sp. MZ04-78.2]